MSVEIFGNNLEIHFSLGARSFYFSHKNDKLGHKDV